MRPSPTPRPLLGAVPTEDAINEGQRSVLAFFLIADGADLDDESECLRVLIRYGVNHREADKLLAKAIAEARRRTAPDHL